MTVLMGIVAGRASRRAGIAVHADAVVVHGLWRTRRLPTDEIKGFSTELTKGGSLQMAHVLVVEAPSSRTRLGEWWSSLRRSGPKCMLEVAALPNRTIESARGL